MKKLLKLFSVLMLVALMTGCVKYDISMEIGSDKSVTIIVIDAIESSLSSYGSTVREADVLEERGFSVEEYNEDGYDGYKLTKKYSNIDEISSTDEVTVELTDLIDETKDDVKVYFQMKKSFFKTTYIANFTFDASGDDSYSSYADSMKLNYSVSLPVKANSQNATSVSEDGKGLTWTLEYGSVNEIKYDFSMVNKSAYFIVCGIIAIVILLIIVVIVNKKKKKPNQYQSVGSMPVPGNNLSEQRSMNNNPTDDGGLNQMNQEQNSIESNTIPNLTDNKDMTNVVNSDTNNFQSLENQPQMFDENNNSQSVSGADSLVNGLTNNTTGENKEPSE